MINRNFQYGASVRTPYWALRTLPPFPPIAVSALLLMATDNLHNNQLVSLIQSDLVFTAELLRIANSARWGFRGNIRGIRHVVSVLGNEALKSLAVSLTMRRYLADTIRNENLARVWRRSLATAFLCELLAESSPPFAPGAYDETPYVAGLLHQLGALGLMVANPTSYAAALATATEQKVDLRTVEKQLFDLDHCQAGRWVALKWRFSPALADLTSSYHEPPARFEFKLADLVKIAGLLADSLGFELVPMSAEFTPDAVRAMLPAAVQTKFLQTDEQLRSMVDERIRGLFEDDFAGRPAAGVGVTQ